MSNNVLALIIIVVSFWAVWGQRTMGQLIGALLIIGGITVSVAFVAAGNGEMGGIYGVGAFVLTLGGFWLYNKFKG